MKIVHPSLNTVIITGLEANAQYSIQVLAFNAYGDGVFSTKYYGGIDVQLDFFNRFLSELRIRIKICYENK